MHRHSKASQSQRAARDEFMSGVECVIDWLDDLHHHPTQQRQGKCKKKGRCGDASDPVGLGGRGKPSARSMAAWLESRRRHRPGGCGAEDAYLERAACGFCVEALKGVDARLTHAIYTLDDATRDAEGVRDIATPFLDAVKRMIAMKRRGERGAEEAGARTCAPVKP